MKNSWRFYSFESDNKYYCFDCFTHKIFSLTNELYECLRNEDYKCIKKNYTSFYKAIIKKARFKTKKQQVVEDCFVTINFSNKCNLNCSYCYRDKKEKSELSEKELKSIFEHILTKYKPNSKGFSFTLCQTSESSLDIQKIKYIDSLVAENEGYLFTNKDITETDAKGLFYKLPKEIVKKYESKDDYIDVLNTILKREKLWLYYSYDNNDYLKGLLSFTKNPCLAKTVATNRGLLNENFPKIKTDKKFSYISVWFMTNGTNITEEYIELLKSFYISEVTVSIDGPEFIHNQFRKYHSNQGSHNDVIRGIKKLQDNGFKVNASFVINPEFTNLNEIIDYFIELKINKLNFNFARGNKYDTLFLKEQINNLLNEFEILFDRIYCSLKDNNDKLINMLKEAIFITFIKELYFRYYKLRRCFWGNEVVIDSKGNMYHCNSTIGIKKDLIGNYKNITFKEVNKFVSIEDDKKCKHCFAKYLCGGTCYMEKIINNTQNIYAECFYRKELIKMSIRFYAKLKNENLLVLFLEKIT